MISRNPQNMYSVGLNFYSWNANNFTWYWSQENIKQNVMDTSVREQKSRERLPDKKSIFHQYFARIGANFCPIGADFQKFVQHWGATWLIQFWRWRQNIKEQDNFLKFGSCILIFSLIFSTDSPYKFSSSIKTFRFSTFTW